MVLKEAIVSFYWLSLRVPPSVQVIVNALKVHELRVRTLLGHASVAHNANGVSIAHRAESVRYHHARASGLRRV